METMTSNTQDSESCVDPLKSVSLSSPLKDLTIQDDCKKQSSCSASHSSLTSRNQEQAVADGAHPKPEANSFKNLPQPVPEFNASAAGHSLISLQSHGTASLLPFSHMPANSHVSYQYPNISATTCAMPQQEGTEEGLMALVHNPCVLNRSFIPGSCVGVYDRLEGHALLRFATDQDGSTRLQNILALRNQELTRQVFERVTASLDGIPIFVRLMMDQYGFYVFLNLVHSCNYQQLALITEKITMDQQLFLNLAFSKYGSSSIKILIKILKNLPLIDLLILNLYGAFYPLMTDRTASSIVSMCLEILNSNQNTLLHEAAIRHCLYLATHERGCLNLNNFIDSMKGSHRHRLLNLISINALFLSQDPSGNFVLQKVLGLKNATFTAKICTLLRGHYLKLSLLKGGSHVVEKCLNSFKMDCVVEDLLNGSTKSLLQVACNRYGNYVMQTALRTTKQVGSPLHSRLLESLQSHIDELMFGPGIHVFNLVVEELTETATHSLKQ